MDTPESGSTTPFWISREQWTEILLQYRTVYVLMAILMVLVAFFTASHCIMCIYTKRKEAEKDREPPPVIVIEPIPNDRPRNKSSKSVCEVPIPAVQRTNSSGAERKQFKEKLEDSEAFRNLSVSTPPTTPKVSDLNVSTPPLKKPTPNIEESNSSKSVGDSKSVSGSNEADIGDAIRIKKSMKNATNKPTTPLRQSGQIIQNSVASDNQAKSISNGQDQVTPTGVSTLNTAVEPAPELATFDKKKDMNKDDNIPKNTTVTTAANAKKSTWV